MDFNLKQIYQNQYQWSDGSFSSDHDPCYIPNKDGKIVGVTENLKDWNYQTKKHSIGQKFLLLLYVCKCVFGFQWFRWLPFIYRLETVINISWLFINVLKEHFWKSL